LQFPELIETITADTEEKGGIAKDENNKRCC
jgi:hypothetical protein